MEKVVRREVKAEGEVEEGRKEKRDKDERKQRISQERQKWIREREVKKKSEREERRGVCGDKPTRKTKGKQARRDVRGEGAYYLQGTHITNYSGVIRDAVSTSQSPPMAIKLCHMRAGSLTLLPIYTTPTYNPL